MKRNLVCALVAATSMSGSAFAGSYTAEPLDHVPSVRVSFADLDIKKEAGAQELYDRIMYAARRACGPRPDNAHFAMVDKWDYCVNDAMKRAVAYVNSPIVNRIAGLSSPAARTAVAAN